MKLVRGPQEQLVADIEGTSAGDLQAPARVVAEPGGERDGGQVPVTMPKSDCGSFPQRHHTAK